MNKFDDFIDSWVPPVLWWPVIAIATLGWFCMIGLILMFAPRQRRPEWMRSSW